MSSLKTFFGKPVKNFEKSGDIVPSAEVCPRIMIDYDTDESLADRLEYLLDEPGIEAIQALVIGSWCGEDSDTDPSNIIWRLNSRASALPDLRALFMGDITSDENEMSWIQQADFSDFWAAYPKLEEFGSRGASGLELGPVSHSNLRKIAIETGGMPSALLQEALDMKTPALEHFEVWLGSNQYGNTTEVGQFSELLAGKLFPNLRVMALRNCDYADDLAEAVATAPILGQLDVLDLSKGTLTDRGAKALIAGGMLSKPARVVISHHFVTDPVLAEMRLAARELIADKQLEPENYGDEDFYYIAVSE